MSLRRSPRTRKRRPRRGWRAMTGTRDRRGTRRVRLRGAPKAATPEECRQIAALYPHEEHFRSHIHMARHGFGKGEYRYFKYPLPDLLGGLAHRALSAARADRQRMERADGASRALSGRACRFSEGVPRCRADPADAAAAAICAGRLQLPAPGPLRRPRLPAAGRDPAVGAGQGFHRRRVRADRAAAAHAEPRRGGAAAPGRRRGLRRPQPAGARHQGQLPGQSAPWRQPPALRPAPHASASSFTTRNSRSRRRRAGCPLYRLAGALSGE